MGVHCIARKGRKVRNVSLPDWVRMAIPEWLGATGMV